MQIIGCQLDIAWEDKQTNHARVREMLSATNVEPGTLVVLPEMFATGYSMHVSTIAEGADGPTNAFLGSLAREIEGFVVGGVVSKAGDGRGRNDAVVYGPEGQQLTRYTKLHPFSYAGETRHYQAGDGIALFDWHDFSVAVFVCYDLRFPEIFRQAVRSGAELMVVIANWPEPRQAHWTTLLRARAIENQCYVAGINRAGDDPHIHYGGGSLILGPRGEPLAEAGQGQQLLGAEIELEPLVEYRRQFPALADMRADFFVD